MLTLLCVPAKADILTLAWDKNPELNVVNYRLSYNVIGSPVVFQIESAGATEVKTPDLASGVKYTFSVVAITDQGAESPPSSSVEEYIVPPIASPFGWKTQFVTNEDREGYPAEYAFDGNPDTFWHTRWKDNYIAPYPFELKIDLGQLKSFNGISYLPRQDGFRSGNVKGFQFFVSLDGINWGDPISSGELPEITTVAEVKFKSVNARYISFNILSTYGAGVGANVAELKLLNYNNPWSIPSAPKNLHIVK